MQRLARLAWLTLGFNLLVIVWGAYVRASKSGDGCGSHWPLCNGDVLPQVSAITTLVEFTHRLTSGVAFFLVVGLVVLARRTYPAGHRVRHGGYASLIFIIIEALIGAVLVRKGLVAHNDSMQRAFVMSVHLVNTFLLLGCLTFTAWAATQSARLRLVAHPALAALSVIGLAAMILLGVSGAIAALGDTLFPVTSLAEALRQDLAPTAHILIRLRVFHPFIALGVGVYLMFVAALACLRQPQEATRRWAIALTAVILTQWLVGLINVLLLAPIPLQLLHLLLADITWIVFIMLAATALAQTVTSSAFQLHHTSTENAESNLAVN